MVTKKDKETLENMIHRLGVADFLATVGNILHDKSVKAFGEQTVDGMTLGKAAEKCWEASEQ